MTSRINHSLEIGNTTNPCQLTVHGSAGISGEATISKLRIGMNGYGSSNEITTTSKNAEETKSLNIITGDVLNSSTCKNTTGTGCSTLTIEGPRCELTVGSDGQTNSFLTVNGDARITGNLFVKGITLQTLLDTIQNLEDRIAALEQIGEPGIAE